MCVRGLGGEADGGAAASGGDVGVVDPDVGYSVVGVDEAGRLRGCLVDEVDVAVCGIIVGKEVELVEEAATAVVLNLAWVSVVRCRESGCLRESMPTPDAAGWQW